MTGSSHMSLRVPSLTYVWWPGLVLDMQGGVLSDLKSGPVWSFCLIWLQPGPGPVLPDGHLSKTRPGLVWTGPCRSFASRGPVETSCNSNLYIDLPNLWNPPSNIQMIPHQNRAWYGLLNSYAQ